ncbi:MAG TPA: hypothetical protein PK954_23530, partial [Anaerolineales bacterium]|nr:hypothetical protein [Anaerolineales bacterium]
MHRQSHISIRSFRWLVSGLLVVGLSVFAQLLGWVPGAVGQIQICPYPDGSPAAFLYCTGGFLNTPTPGASPTASATATRTQTATRTPSRTPTLTPTPPPVLDPGYGAGGIAYQPSAWPVRGADIQSDGKIVVLQQDGYDAVLTRWGLDGQQDLAFGTAGVLRHTVP